ncbi:MAG: twin-arginine translocase subunit TatB [Proteobacteria bacterium]|nr:twin-arginine translocase subunit TatB [Pseudomonadota bacterium]
MFDLEWSKLLVIGVIALLVIKPKDLPKALNTLGYWVRHARQVAAEFQRSLEQMAREAEIPDVKKELEDAGRQLTADVEKSLDPVEVEKLFNPLPPEPSTATASIEPPADVATPLSEPPAPAAPEEPHLPFPEPLPTQSPPVTVHPPALEPAGSQSSPHDRG